jgi:hypothetical protein
VPAPRKPALLPAARATPADLPAARRAAVSAARASAGPSGRCARSSFFTDNGSFNTHSSSGGSGRKQRPASYMARAMQAACYTDEEAGSDADEPGPATSPARSTGSAGTAELGWFQQVEAWEEQAGARSANKAAADGMSGGSGDERISRGGSGQGAKAQRKGSVTFADPLGADGRVLGRQGSRSGRAGQLGGGGGVARSAGRAPGAAALRSAEAVKRKVPHVLDLLAGESDDE